MSALTFLAIGRRRAKNSVEPTMLVRGWGGKYRPVKPLKPRKPRPVVTKRGVPVGVK